MINLTSVNHVCYYMSINEDAFANDINTKRKFAQLIPSVSNAIANFCDRDFELKNVTQYYDTFSNKKSFYVSNYPIQNVVSIESDSEGLFTGSQTVETDTFFNAFDSAIVLSNPVSPSERGLKINYNGGLAVDPTLVTIKLATGHDNFDTTQMYVQGCRSFSFGKIISYNEAEHTIVIDVYYGSFLVGETITQQTSEGQNCIGENSGTIESFVTLPLCMSNPDLVLACEVEIRYLSQHRHDMENLGTNKDGTTIRRTPYFTEYSFQPETLGLLAKYKRLSV